MHIMGYIGIGFAVLIIAILVGHYFLFKNLSAVCPHCRHAWRVKFLKALFSIHLLDTIGVTCPKCGERGLKELVRNKDLEN